MSSNSLPRFSTSKLQEAAHKYSSTITSFSANLDGISTDIKTLEAWLQEHGVCLPFQVVVQSSGMNFAEPSQHNQALDMYDGPVIRTTELVKWNRQQETGRWRIFYVRMEERGDVEIDGGMVLSSSFEPEVEAERRPLIETPAEVRLRAYEKLPDLLQLISDGVRSERMQLPQ